jgi:hypothetical protein
MEAMTKKKAEQNMDTLSDTERIKIQIGQKNTKRGRQKKKSMVEILPLYYYIYKYR